MKEQGSARQWGSSRAEGRPSGRSGRRAKHVVEDADKGTGQEQGQRRLGMVGQDSAGHCRAGAREMGEQVEGQKVW